MCEWTQREAVTAGNTGGIDLERKDIQWGVTPGALGLCITLYQGCYEIYINFSSGIKEERPASLFPHIQQAIHPEQ